MKILSMWADTFSEKEAYVLQEMEPHKGIF